MHCWAKRRHLHDWRLQSTPGLDAVPSRSPSAPLILSKSHYNPTNPTASHHDCLLSGSSALHIRIWSWAGGSSPPPLPSLRKLIPPHPLCAFSSSLLVNALEAWLLGQRKPALGRWLVIHSKPVLEKGFYWPMGTPFSPHLCAITWKHPRWRKTYWWISVKYAHTAKAGRQDRKLLMTMLIVEFKELKCPSKHQTYVRTKQ